MLNGGYGTIKIGIGIYGIKSKLCLKLSNSDIHSITGEFRNNTIEVGNFIFKLNMHSKFFYLQLFKGPISLTFNDGTFCQGFAQNGKFITYIRHYDSSGKLLNMTDMHSGKYLHV